MSVALTLLGLLEREANHGYDLKRDYDTYFRGGKRLPYGEVARAAERGEGPDGKRYTITEAGIAACADREVIVRECRVTALTGVASAPRAVP